MAGPVQRLTVLPRRSPAARTSSRALSRPRCRQSVMGTAAVCALAWPAVASSGRRPLRRSRGDARGGAAWRAASRSEKRLSASARTVQSGGAPTTGAATDAGGAAASAASPPRFTRQDVLSYVDTAGSLTLAFPGARLGAAGAGACAGASAAWGGADGGLADAAPLADVAEAARQRRRREIACPLHAPLQRPSIAHKRCAASALGCHPASAGITNVRPLPRCSLLLNCARQVVWEGPENMGEGASRGHAPLPGGACALAPRQLAPSAHSLRAPVRPGCGRAGALAALAAPCTHSTRLRGARMVNVRVCAVLTCLLRGPQVPERRPEQGLGVIQAPFIHRVCWQSRAACAQRP
jgi:hypothetical protein